MNGPGNIGVICGLAPFRALSTPQTAVQPRQPVEPTGDVKVAPAVSENGNECRVPKSPDTVMPGDRQVLVTNYRNTTGEVVKEFAPNTSAAIRFPPGDAGIPDLAVNGPVAWSKLAAFTVSDGKGGRRSAKIDGTA